MIGVWCSRHCFHRPLIRQLAPSLLLLLPPQPLLLLPPLLSVVSRVWLTISCDDTGANSASRSRRRVIGDVTGDVMKVLNVAEKNDAARSIAQLLAGGNTSRREGFSKFNKIYEFDYNLLGQSCRMVMTSVSGHLLNYEFPAAYRKWTSCSPLQLFDCPVVKSCSKDYEPIKRTLEREIRGASRLIIWTDCDREGENIGFEIIDVCRAVKPNIVVLRARFSEITAASVRAAVQRLQQPDARANSAVDVRQQLDLRIGAAFTRFQTLRLSRVFPASLAQQLISYGSCQFPTLGFVVERFKAIENFVQEPFWKIRVTHTTNDGDFVEFGWLRNRLFDQLSCQVLFDRCCDNPTATVVTVKSKPKSKWRPLPLDTVEFEKLCSRKLRISAKNAMRIAEKLYTQGYISYPRTETNIFPRDMPLRPLVEKQTDSTTWGDYARRLLATELTPRQGKKSDQAHPPIHPIKYAASLSGDEARVYELVVRHFLACLSRDAQGHETTVYVTVADEQFSVSGLAILARNYLEVYPYDKWSERQIPVYSVGQSFTADVAMDSGTTCPPGLLTEADLITLMEKHGIGTDATHAEHIETIKSRQYVGVQDGRFLPGRLGLGLVQGYDSMGFHMSKPHLRAELEADLKRICVGTRQPDTVLTEQILKYRRVFEEALQKASCLDTALADYIDETPANQPLSAESGVLSANSATSQPLTVRACPQCQQPIVIKTARESGRPFLACCGYPLCRVVLWLPDTVQSVEPVAARCRQCAGAPALLRFVFAGRDYAPYYGRQHTACVAGCDDQFMEVVGLRWLGTGPAAPPRPARASPPADSAGTQSDSGISNAASLNSASIRHSQQQQQQMSVSTAAPMSFSALSATTTSNNSGGVCGGGGGWSDHARTQRSFLTHQTALSLTAPHSASASSSLAASNAEGAISCTCGVPAKQLTVRKEGANKGRQFYRCGADSSSSGGDGRGCSFFLWAVPDDEGGATGESRDSHVPTGVSSVAPPGGAVCRCGLPARRATVQKLGPNQGRSFMACSKPRDQQCNFFEWADTNSLIGSDDQLDGGSFGRARGGRARGRGRSRTRGAAGSARRCGACRQPGHTRNNCPDAV